MSPSSFPNLLSPLQVGPKRVRNRLLITGHVPGLADDNLPGPRYVAYHRARARGGAGMQMTGSTDFHVTGGLASGRNLRNLDDRIVPGYRALGDAVHEEGGLILAQLGHSSATVAYSDAGIPLWAPSPVASRIVKQVPHQMTVSEIEQVVDAYAAATGRVREGGLDGVEILGAFGFLIAAFASPATNRRDDDYGGSLDNRLRFAREVIAAVREAAGDGLIVGMRIPGDEQTEDGLTNADMIPIARALARTGGLDYLNVIAGTNMARLPRMEHWPPTPAPHGLFVPLAAAIREAVDIPVFTTGRITDPALAEQLLADGKVDMVGMTRAHIADPEIGRKIAEGRPEDIRPCVGANTCISRAMAGGPIRCFHNPEAARELDWGAATPAATPKSVAVIGGGPAGLEAARVAAERGHRVTLYEKAPRLGGQMALWSQTPLVGEFARSIDWYEQQLRKLQVRIETSRAVTGRELCELDADAVIVATGSLPAPLPQLDGAETSSVRRMSPHAAIADPPGDASHAVLIDEGGLRTGLAAAEMLAERGSRVTVVTAESAVGEAIDGVVRTPIYKHLLKHAVRFVPNVEAVRLAGNALVVRNIYSGDEETIENVDITVEWHGNRVEDSLAASVRDGVTVDVIGDAVSPRTVDVATAEGAMAARRV